MKFKIVLLLTILFFVSCIKPKPDPAPHPPNPDDSTEVLSKDSVETTINTNKDKPLENGKIIAVVLFEAQREQYYIIERNSKEWKLKDKEEQFDRGAKQVNVSVSNNREQKKLQIVNQIIQEINSKCNPDKIYFIANSIYVNRDEDIKDYKDIIENIKKETFEFFNEEGFRSSTIPYAIQFALSKKLDD